MISTEASTEDLKVILGMRRVALDESDSTLTAAAWDQNRQPNQPSARQLSRKHGSWGNACRNASVRSGRLRPSRAGAVIDQTHFRRCLKEMAAQGNHVSITRKAFDVWRSSQIESPSRKMNAAVTESVNVCGLARAVSARDWDVMVLAAVGLSGETVRTAKWDAATAASVVNEARCDLGEGFSRRSYSRWRNCRTEATPSARTLSKLGAFS